MAQFYFNPMTGESDFDPYGEDQSDPFALFAQQQQQQQQRLPPFNPAMFMPPPGQAPAPLPPEVTNDPGVMSHVLELLGYLDRPRNAVASAAQAVQRGRGAGDAASAAWEGFMGDRQVSWGDIFGIPEGKPTDEWGPWLAKEGGRLATDVVLDPLNLIPLLKVPKAISALPKVQKAAEAIYGSSWGRALLHGVPEHQAEYSAAKEAALRGMGERSMPVLEKIKEAKPLEAEAMKTFGADQLALRDMFERNTGRLPKDINEVYEWLHGQSGERLNTMNDLLESLGMKPVGMIPEGDAYRWVPRVMTEAGERRARDLIKGGIPTPEKFGSRILKRAVIDTEEGLFNPVGNKPLIVNMEHPEWSGLVKKGEDWFLQKEGQELPVRITEASAKEIADTGIMKGREFIPGAMESYGHDILKKDRQIAFLEFLKSTKMGGWLKPAEEFARVPGAVMPTVGGAAERTLQPGSWVFASDMGNYGKVLSVTGNTAKVYFKSPEGAEATVNLAADLLTPLGGKVGSSVAPKIAETALREMGVPPGWREVRIPGFEGHFAPKWAANDIEKASRKLFDPETPMGALEEIGARMLDTRLGRLLQDGTSWWKSNVLGLAPSYYLGNIASNLPQMYLGNVNPAMIPVRSYQAGAVYAGIGRPIFDGMTNRELGDALRARKIFKGEGTFSGETLAEIGEGQGRVRSAAENLWEPFQTVGKGVASVGEAIGKANRYMLSKGQLAEDNARAGVAIDWLKRNVKSGTPTPQQLDKAAAFARNAMIDYDALTPFEKIIKSFIPFYAWQRGIMGRTLEVATTRPDQLAKLGRFLDTIMEPMDPYDKQISDDWVKENAPITSIMGVPLDKIMASGTGDPQMFMAGRYLPHTSIEQATKRPKDYLLSIINPWLKAPVELATNWSSFKNRAIDELAPGPAGMFGGSLSGQPYEPSKMRWFGQSVPAAWDYIMANAPGGRTARALSQIGDIAGTTENPGAPRSMEAPWTETGLGLATGFKFYPFDQMKNMSRRKYEHQEKLNRIKAKWNAAATRGDMDQADQYAEMWNTWQGKLAEAYGFTN